MICYRGEQDVTRGYEEEEEEEGLDGVFKRCKRQRAVAAARVLLPSLVGSAQT
jgi:hypothetical protein